MGSQSRTRLKWLAAASLCLLVGAFNPFMFKVIIDKYDPVAIYFIVLGLGFYTFLNISCLENIL